MSRCSGEARTHAAAHSNACTSHPLELDSHRCRRPLVDVSNDFAEGRTEDCERLIEQLEAAKLEFSKVAPGQSVEGLQGQLDLLRDPSRGSTEEAMLILFAGTGAELVDIDTALEECGVLVTLVDHDVFKVIPPEERAGKAVYDTRGIWPDVA